MTTSAMEDPIEQTATACQQICVGQAHEAPRVNERTWVLYVLLVNESSRTG